MVKTTEFIKELSDTLIIGSKLSDVFQKVHIIFTTKYGTKNFFFGTPRKIIYGIGDKTIHQVLNLVKTSSEDLNYKDVDCVMRFNNDYFLYFDINNFTTKEDILITFSLIDNFLKNTNRFESIYNRFKYLKALVYSIEPLIYEISIKNALTQALISLITFTEIEKSIVATISGKKIEIISNIGVEKEIFRTPQVKKWISQLIKTKKEVFVKMDICNENKNKLVGILPLGDFNEIKGLIIVVFNSQKETIEEIDKEILKILSFVITHRIKLYELNLNLLKAKRKAEELSRLKSEFVANVSHELRTPLNAILGFVELLKIGEFSREEEIKYLDHIMSAGTSLLTMINNILDLSKIEAGGIKPIITEISVEELIDDIKRLGEVLTKNKGIDFILENRLPIKTIRSDYSMLKSILTNIISNAIKFTDKGWVKTSLYLQNDKVVFRIEDTGIGLKESDINKIFLPFVQLEEVRNKKYSGTGIGLSLAKKFADMIDARIVPKTKGLGKGCIFFVILNKY